MSTLILRTAVAAAALILSACGGGAEYHSGGGNGGSPYPRPNPQPYPPTMSCSSTGLAAAAQSSYPTVCMLTSSGEMVIELYPGYAPVTVNNFLRYVSDGFYSNTLFHHVDRDFVIQGGGYTTGMRVKSPTYAPIVSESNNGLSNLVGTVAMARRTDPNSATSQFFINVIDNSRALDYESPSKPGYTVFGRVISGMSTVYAINGQPTYYYGATDIQPQQEVLVYWVQRLR
ncbi:peptidylprolyl isomerase [Mitsuaria sp. WAJ17]|uniref:peptidylprolyl isomerase n=1 Tax=Mitsuaria sp. WAJ17 TaxID=2761452 RepID=UPI001603CEE2|nr:peptidylprolyl isomerase [Mitsuaria sp. WAJ17]MBB2483822.1 peptidylprolyl isomerase [Mitsuaria sp. WAJ17]